MKNKIWNWLWRRSPASDAASASSADEPEELLPETVVVTDLLDLHGTPLGIIPQMIDDFIDNAVELGLERVQIIHGKGKSRFKHMTHQKLATHPRVIGFGDARPEDGGWGRTVVRLKVKRLSRKTRQRIDRGQNQ